MKGQVCERCCKTARKEREKGVRAVGPAHVQGLTLLSDTASALLVLYARLSLLCLHFWHEPCSLPYMHFSRILSRTCMDLSLSSPPLPSLSFARAFLSCLTSCSHFSRCQTCIRVRLPAALAPRLALLNNKGRRYAGMRGCIANANITSTPELAGIGATRVLSIGTV